jgi:hypothetical protein
MGEEAEVHRICKKYESFRLRDTNREKYLMHSILQCGVRQPLQCIDAIGKEFEYILLDGFKRLRCCYKLNIHTVPVSSLGTDEVSSILQLIRLSADRGLSTLEQARFVDELHSCHRLSVTEIARALERSPAWVSVRLGMIGAMSPVVREAVFCGRFPVRSYMYTLKQFMGVHRIPSADIDGFVTSVSSKGLSTRDIDKLAYAYFRGGKQLRQQIQTGNLEWTLRRMNEQEPAHTLQEQMSQAEWNVIRDLELVQKYICRILWGLNTQDLCSDTFHAHALLLIEGLLGRIEEFTAQIRSFHDRRTSQADSQNPR